MKGFKTIISTAVVGIALSTGAQAVTLYTAPASAGFANAKLYCTLVNTRSTPLTATVDVMDSVGQVAATSGSVSVAPGMDHYDVSDSGTYCRFTVSGSKSAVRAGAQYISNSTSHSTITVPAQ